MSPARLLTRSILGFFAPIALIALALPITGCRGDAEPAAPPHSWMDCEASDQAFVRRAMLALNGRRALSQAEVNAQEDILKGIRSAEGIEAPLPSAGSDSAREALARAMMSEDAFRARWSDFFMDALLVARIDVKSQALCYGDPGLAKADDGALAAYVRDNDPIATSPPTPGFTMGQLVASSIELDDLSPLYRAHLFAMMARPLNAANVGELELERARRQDFGAAFEASYLNRDRTCLPCHNSEYSVTFNVDPAKNRAWPLLGFFERALFGSSDGTHPLSEAAEKGSDDLRARAMFRFMGVAEGEGRSAPYGISPQCGLFKPPADDDPLGVDAYFGSLRSTADSPSKGRRVSIWDLERALHRGVDRLAEGGLSILASNEIEDPDEAFAYLVAAGIVNRVWAEVMGSRLTIANYFPRTEAQRDILLQLTTHFVASHFSLKRLLLDIVEHPSFNLKPPAEGCGAAAYELPPILDPWASAENDPARRPNSPADGVFAISPRALRSALHRAMEWPSADPYPLGQEQAFQAAVGYFLKDAEPGFRGLDFQGRLAWEAMYGACAPPIAEGKEDFISKLAARAASTPGATLGDAVIALKDRLVGEPWIDDANERPLLEALLGAPLTTTNLEGADKLLRAACGAITSSPQMMLGGILPIDTRIVPKLTPASASYAAACESLAARLTQTGAPYRVKCGDGSLSVER